MISVITPTHSLARLQACADALMRQTTPHWRWIVVANGQVQPEEIRRVVGRDPRVTVSQASYVLNNNIGALKRFACDQVRTPYILELDHDDELAGNGVARVLEEFEKNEAAFVYSRTVHCDDRGKSIRFPVGSEWRYETMTFQGRETETVEAVVNPPLLPQNLARTELAPCHVRAWRTDAYQAAGGHDPALTVGDDTDLMCRLYLSSSGRFSEIGECLYKYRNHEANSFKAKSGVLRDNNERIYYKYIQPLAELHWRGQAQCVEVAAARLGAGRTGWLVVPLLTAPNARWDLADDSVGLMRIDDWLHLCDAGAVLAELQRCMVHGGIVIIDVVSTEGLGGFQDPASRSYWNPNTFMFLAQRRLPGERGYFKIVKMSNHHRSDWHRQHRVMHVRVHLGFSTERVQALPGESGRETSES